MFNVPSCMRTSHRQGKRRPCPLEHGFILGLSIMRKGLSVAYNVALQNYKLSLESFSSPSHSYHQARRENLVWLISTGCTNTVEFLSAACIWPSLFEEGETELQADEMDNKHRVFCFCR